MSNKTKILLVKILMLFSLSATADSPPPLDILTYGCLGYYTEGSDPTVKACAQLYPYLKPQLEEARRKWEVRNAEDILAMKSACQTRLNRVYGNNKVQLAIAKEQAQRLEQEMINGVVSDPNAENRIDCRSYIEDYSKGTTKTDSLRELIAETRDGPIK